MVPCSGPAVVGPMAVLTTVVVGVALGVLAASKHNAWFDTISMSGDGLRDALDPRMRL